MRNVKTRKDREIERTKERKREGERKRERERERERDKGRPGRQTVKKFSSLIIDKQA